MAAQPDTRTQDLARIHVAKKELGLDDDAYRDMLYTVARVRSAGDLDAEGRRRVIQHLRSKGWNPARRKKRPHPGAPHNLRTGDRSPQMRKVEALLADAGRPWSYADAVCRRMFRVDRVAFCDEEQLQSLIAALEYDRRRRERRK